MPKTMFQRVIDLSFEDRMNALKSGPRRGGAHTALCIKAMTLRQFPCICLAVKNKLISFEEDKEPLEKAIVETTKIKPPKPKIRRIQRPARDTFLDILLSGSNEQKEKLAREIIGQLEDNGMNMELVAKLEQIVTNMGKKYLLMGSTPTVVIKFAKILFDVRLDTSSEEKIEEEECTGNLDSELPKLRIGYLGANHGAFFQAKGSLLKRRKIQVEFINALTKYDGPTQFDVLIINRHWLRDHDVKRWDGILSGKVEAKIKTTSVPELQNVIISLARRVLKKV